MLYRLKLLQKNEQYQYSPLRLVRIEDKAIQIALKENPVRNTLAFAIANADGSFNAEIVGAAGQKYAAKQFASSSAQTFFELPVKELVPGIYFLIIKNNSLIKSLPFLKD